MINLNVKMFNDKILVKPLVEQSTTKSGILIPQSVFREGLAKGEVISVGKSCEIKIGEVVVYSPLGVPSIKLGEEDYFVVREDQIYMTLFLGTA